MKKDDISSSLLDPTPHFCIDSTDLIIVSFSVFSRVLQLYAHALYVQGRLMNTMAVSWDYHLT